MVAFDEGLNIPHCISVGLQFGDYIAERWGWHGYTLLDNCDQIETTCNTGGFIPYVARANIHNTPVMGCFRVCHAKINCQSMHGGLRLVSDAASITPVVLPAN